MKYTLLISYALITQFERPDWCMKILVKKVDGTPAEQEEYINFDPDYCDNNENVYTSSGMIKLNPLITIPFEMCCLLLLLFFQWMRNQYREHDDSSQFSW